MPACRAKGFRFLFLHRDSLFHRHQYTACDQYTHQMEGTADGPVQYWPRNVGVDGDVDGVRHQVADAHHERKRHRIAHRLQVQRINQDRACQRNHQGTKRGPDNENGGLVLQGFVGAPNEIL